MREDRRIGAFLRAEMTNSKQMAEPGVMPSVS